MKLQGVECMAKVVRIVFLIFPVLFLSAYIFRQLSWP
jgi:hypothetical protein